MKKYLIGVAIILVAGGAYWYSTIRGPVRIEQADPLDGSGFGNGDSADVMDEAPFDYDLALVGQLVDVSGGDATGTAWSIRENGNLHHVVQAQLPAPDGDTVYEGWLVRKLPTVEFFSTGVLTQVADGAYALSFSTDSVHEGFDDVVITLETVVDETPEMHILEGTVRPVVK